MTRVLFLDVDGVLNHEAVYRSRKFGSSPIDPECSDRLSRLIDQTGCKVVLSSSWRGVPALERKLRNHGISKCAHPDFRTCELRGEINNRRGREIAEWLGRHPEILRYAIVDDDDDMLPEQRPFFVQTTFKTGLTDEHVERLAAILKRPA